MTRLLGSIMCLLGLLVGCTQPSPAQPTPVPQTAPRQRPVIPADWPAGKRIVMHVTPGLDHSFVSACDIPVPALTYLRRGHKLTLIVDNEAVTSYRRDANGKTPLDKLPMLDDDLDELSTMLGVPRADAPREFGTLYREMAHRGVRIVANADALRTFGIEQKELDPVVEVISADEVRRLMQDLDALLPYDDIGPMHSIFAHRVDQPQQEHKPAH